MITPAVVINVAPLKPKKRPNSPANKLPIKGNNSISKYIILFLFLLTSCRDGLGLLLLKGWQPSQGWLKREDAALEKRVFCS